MATYHVTAPTGETYEVNGPDGATNEQVLAQVQAHHAAQPSQQEAEAHDVMSAPLAAPRAREMRQAGQGMFEGVTGTPGLPVDALFGVGNWARRQLSLPETPLESSPLRSWGSEGWRQAANRATGATDNAAPQNEGERLARKAGTFVGSAAPFGLRAIALAPESFIGSEVGRATDQAGWTGGYGEVAGSLVGPGVRPGIRVARTAISGTRDMLANAKPETLAPSNAALQAESNAAFDAIRNSDVIIKPEGVNRLAQTVRGYLANQGYTPKLQPGIGAVLDELDTTIQNGNTTYQGLINLRRIAQHAGEGNVPGGQGHMAGVITDHIDDFLDDLPNRPGDVLTGNPAQAVETLRQANSAWSRFKKSETLDAAIRKALLNAGPHVGNVEGSIATQLKNLLTNKRTARQFSPAEQEAITRIVHGDNVQNVLRYVGKFSPENIIPALFEGSEAIKALTLSGGVGAVNPLAGAGALATMATGFLARRGAGARTNAAVNALSERFRSAPPKRMVSATSPGPASPSPPRMLSPPQQPPPSPVALSIRQAPRMLSTGSEAQQLVASFREAAKRNPLDDYHLAPLTAKAQELHAGAIKEVQTILSRIAPGAKQTPYRAMSYKAQPGAEPSTVYGAYVKDPSAGPLITYALELEHEGARFRAPAADTARHEAIHYLSDQGFFTPQEWTTLSRAAQEQGWLKKYGISDTYAHLNKSGEQYSMGHFAQIEEAVAEAYSRGRAESFKSFSPPVRAILLKLHDLYQAVGSSMRRVFGDKATARDIFDLIENGKVGSRTPKRYVTRN